MKDFAKGFSSGVKDTVKFAGKVKKVVAGEGYQRDPEQQKKDRHHSKQPDPSKDGFTGIGNMSIDDIMKLNAKIKAKDAKKGVKEHHEKDADGNVVPHKTAPLTEGALVRNLLEGKA